MIERNTTQDLVADLEALRVHLGIERWLVFGGSWGATLALAYAQAHPQRCLGLVLRGIFLARQLELDWFLHGMRNVFPEAWRAFAEFLPEEERGDLLASYHRRLTDPDPAVHLPAAHAWDRYEGACSTLLPASEGPRRSRTATPRRSRSRGSRRTTSCTTRFSATTSCLPTSAGSRHLPCTIVQGRYDIVCPPVTADALARAWPEAEYIVVADAGHSVREPGITRELVAAVGRMQARVSSDALGERCGRETRASAIETRVVAR